MRARGWSGLVFAAALLAPAQALATSCYIAPPPTGEQLSTPAGVTEYREATTVAVVRFERAAQPPCWWIKVSRWIRPDAYPKDICEPSGRSQRYTAVLVEALKGKTAARSPAIFASSHPIELEWLFPRRPEAAIARPGSFGSAHEDPWVPKDIAGAGHSAFSFRHRGRIRDATVTLELQSCRDRTAPFVQTFQGSMPFLVFRNAKGEIVHWEMVPGDNDVLWSRMRRLRDGETDVREPIEARVFFAASKIVIPYEIKWCSPAQTRIRPVGGLRAGVLDRHVYSQWVQGRPERDCRAGQRFLVVGASMPADYERGEDDWWPTLQLIPITDGAIRTADIVTQFRIEGPETIPVAQALAWTD